VDGRLQCDRIGLLVGVGCAIIVVVSGGTGPIPGGRNNTSYHPGRRKGGDIDVPTNPELS
jgi:hypothetical protein